jgi:REP element-mobilizing transposase RayT
VSANPVSGTALAAGPEPQTMNETITYFITWTTYGTWLPGDSRGWRKWKKGEQQPRPLLEAWCRERMKGKLVILNSEQRAKVEGVCHRHAEIRGWTIHAINVRSNHVHIVVTADAAPAKVRDQFKANATRVLRQETDPIANETIWTRGGDAEIVDGDNGLEQVVLYVTDAQDRMERGK